jgi:hypothetical protein
MNYIFFVILLLFPFLLQKVDGKETYVYNADYLRPDDIPSRQLLLIHESYICKTGWVVINYKNDMMTLLCNERLIADFDPIYYDRYMDHGVPLYQDTISFDRLVKVSIPWIIQGTCEETVYLCKPPENGTVWSATCENSIQHTYHVCREVILVGLGKMGTWRRDNAMHHSYQLMQPEETCPPCHCPTVHCPEKNCTAELLANGDGLCASIFGGINGPTKNTIALIFVAGLFFFFLNATASIVLVPLVWKTYHKMKEYKTLIAGIKGEKTLDAVILKNLESELDTSLPDKIDINDSEL